jgi:hypothetical protein
VSANRAAERLDLELVAHGLPRAFRCPALGALEDWLRYEKARGGLFQRIGLAFALEAVKTLRARHCKETP